MGLIRHPDRGQFTGEVLLGKVDRIPPVGLDPLAWLSRDQRWCDDGSCPLTWCKSVDGHCALRRGWPVCQSAAAGKLTMALSLRGAMVSSVM